MWKLLYLEVLLRLVPSKENKAQSSLVVTCARLFLYHGCQNTMLLGESGCKYYSSVSNTDESSIRPQREH